MKIYDLYLDFILKPKCKFLVLIYLKIKIIDR